MAKNTASIGGGVYDVHGEATRRLGSRIRHAHYGAVADRAGLIVGR